MVTIWNDIYLNEDDTTKKNQIGRTTQDILVITFKVSLVIFVTEFISRS